MDRQDTSFDRDCGQIVLKTDRTDITQSETQNERQQETQDIH